MVSDLLISVARSERQEARVRIQHDVTRLGGVGVMRFGRFAACVGRICVLIFSFDVIFFEICKISSIRKLEKCDEKVNESMTYIRNIDLGVCEFSMGQIDYVRVLMLLIMHLMCARAGTVISEVWEDGQAMKDIQARLVG